MSEIGLDIIDQVFSADTCNLYKYDLLINEDMKKSVHAEEAHENLPENGRVFTILI